MALAQLLQRSLVSRGRIALPEGRRPDPEPADRSDVGDQTEPFEVVAQGCLELRPATLPIVVLDPKQYLAPESAGNAPDVNRIHHVTQVEIATRSGREPGPRKLSGRQRRVNHVGGDEYRPVNRPARSPDEENFSPDSSLARDVFGMLSPRVGGCWIFARRPI